MSLLWQEHRTWTCVLQVFTDASHAPGGARSHECTVLRCEGSTVGWVSSRQPFSTQSWCEAELLATTTGSNYAVAHVSVLLVSCGSVILECLLLTTT